MSTITSAHDSIIVLRNNDYWGKSRLLLDYTLACLRQGEMPDDHRSWIEQLLLGLAPLFFTGINPIIDAETARMYARKAWIFPYGYKSSRWLPQTRRAEFEIEYTVARRRSLASRERFWLNSQTLRSRQQCDAMLRRANVPGSMGTASHAIRDRPSGYCGNHQCGTTVPDAGGHLTLDHAGSPK
jgi:hypothetical protein